MLNDSSEHINKGIEELPTDMEEQLCFALYTASNSMAKLYTQATSRCLLQSYHSAFRTRHTCEGMWLPFEQV